MRVSWSRGHGPMLDVPGTPGQVFCSAMESAFSFSRVTKSAFLKLTSQINLVLRCRHSKL